VQDSRSKRLEFNSHLTVECGIEEQFLMRAPRH